MSTRTVHQLLHGYQDGHRRLAGSLRLSASDEDLISRISDLSGPLFGEREFQPYFTGYPLSKGKYYAVARTWLDSEAPRAGCVLTHTLLIPAGEIGEIENLQALFDLLGSIPKRDALSRYEDPISLFSQSSVRPSRACVDKAMAVDFINKYFGEGLRPILWLDAPCPEDIAGLLFSSLWPRMRRQFAFCTLSLQLRSLDDRPFDLLFAPSSRRSKHHQLERRNVVGVESAETSRLSKDPQTQRWQPQLAKEIFSGRSRGLPFRDEFPELWASLEPDPTAISRMYRLRELMDRMSTSPMAAVGIMDLLSSLAPEGDQSLACKARMVHQGIETSSSLSDPLQSLRTLYLIGDRLEQRAFSAVDEGIVQRMADVVAEMTRRNPDGAIETGQRVILMEDATRSPYVVGVARGLAKIAGDNPSKLLELNRAAVSAPIVIAAEPTVAAAYYSATRDSLEAEMVSRELTQSIGYVEKEADRRRLREVLLPQVATHEDSTVLRELLKDLPSRDVTATLDCIEQATNSFSSDVIQQVVAAEISEQHPFATREWARQSKSWSFGTTTVTAASFGRSPQGLDDLLSYSGSAFQQSLLLAAFIEHQHKYRIPEWLQTCLRDDAELVIILLSDGVQDIPATCAVIERVLEIPDIPLTPDESLFTVVERFQEASFSTSLVDATMSRAISEYIGGSIKKREFSQWAESAFGRVWFDRVPYPRLASLLVQAEDITVSRWSCAWSVLQYAPDTIYTRRYSPVDKLVDLLLRSHLDEWTEEVSVNWVSIIRRAEDVGARSLHLTLCVKALNYSINHLDLPLSKVVVESFPVVYNHTLTKDSSLSWLRPLSYLFSDWDKGKELRRQIVQSFLKSEWPPEDLALAMPDKQTLRKIFKRLHRRSGGDRFITRMLTGLEKHKDPKATKMYRTLKELVESPEFDESWI